ncbi:MAG: TIGR00703 family protein [Epsilonproteobacteria bacterium]|nr:TIGR00703 family protein [Campylobacterota bacterium]
MSSDIKEIMLLNTLVFETLGSPEAAREFKLKSLKKWGFDLVFGKVEGEEGYFISQDKKEGDKFELNGERFEVIEILKELPKNKKVFAHIEMMEGRAYLFVDLVEKEDKVSLLQLPAGEILLAFLKKHKFMKIIEAIRDLGSAARLVKSNRSEGKPYSFEELPPVPRRFLREAKKIEKEMGFGRISMAYFGEDKERRDQYNIEWMVPTIALFDEHIAQKIDKTLAELG